MSQVPSWSDGIAADTCRLVGQPELLHAVQALPCKPDVQPDHRLHFALDTDAGHPRSGDCSGLEEVA